MRRYAQTALLLLLGGLMLKLAFTGRYARYVGDAHLPLLILGGLGLVAIAGVTLWRDIRALGRPGDDDATSPMTLGGMFGTVTLSAPDRTGSQGVVEAPDADRMATQPEPPSTVEFRQRAVAAGLAAAAHEGLDESRAGAGVAAANEPTALVDAVAPPATREPPHPDVPPVDPFGPAPSEAGSASVLVAGTRAGWALLLAALAILVLAPPALGIDAAARLGTLPVTTDTSALPPGDPVALSLVDYVERAIGGGGSLEGRRVRLVGFVLAGPHGEPYLARLVVGCCAAGARPVKVGLTGDLPGVLTPGAWLAVIGTRSELVDRDPVNGALIPYLSVVEISALEPPTDPYER